MSVANESVAEYSLWDFKGVVPYVDDWTLMRNPAPVLIIWLSYLAFVLKIGPEFMKKRRPFKLNNILIVYNFIQVIYSTYLFAFGYKLILKYGIVHPQCLMEIDDVKRIFVVGIYYFFVNKVVDLLDTVFFVLRKKYNQVTFLHVYHHSVTLILTWLFIKYDISFTMNFLVTLNSFVHICMYSYYFLSAFPTIAKYLWWKKYITKLQLLTAGGYCYFLGKISELLDTVFFVLRKNYRQVTFLHVYHHSIAVMYCWAGLKYDPTPSALFLITINSFVHMVMYAYYGLSAFPKLSKYLWWKKYITTMQLVQFMLIIIQLSVDFKYSKCRPSYLLFGTVLLNLTLFLYLFGDFYVKSYTNKDKVDVNANKVKDAAVNGKTNISTQNGLNNNGIEKKIK